MDSTGSKEIPKEDLNELFEEAKRVTPSFLWGGNTFYVNCVNILYAQMQEENEHNIRRALEIAAERDAFESQISALRLENDFNKSLIEDQKRVMKSQQEEKPKGMPDDLSDPELMQNAINRAAKIMDEKDAQISALRSENERLKGELAESAKLISTIVLDAVEYLHPDDVKKGREIILKHYPNPTT